MQPLSHASAELAQTRRMYIGRKSFSTAFLYGDAGSSAVPPAAIVTFRYVGQAALPGILKYLENRILFIMGGTELLKKTRIMVQSSGIFFSEI
jgi:hypothetical protein